MSKPKEALAWLALIVGGGLVGFYLTGIWLKHQWEKFLEETP